VTDFAAGGFFVCIQAFPRVPNLNSIEESRLEIVGIELVIVIDNLKGSSHERTGIENAVGLPSRTTLPRSIDHIYTENHQGSYRNDHSVKGVLGGFNDSFVHA
jgi:hypothetical protein